MIRLVAIFVSVSAVLAGCMDSLNDYEDCVTIETARCDLRESCDPGFDLSTCVAYYKEFCRTREIDGPLGKNASDNQVAACVAAIATYGCDLDPKVDETTDIPACEFLWPKEPDEDSGTDVPPDAGL